MLIFRNGTATYDLQAEITIDARGNAVAVESDSDEEESITKQVSCYIETLSEDKKGNYESGKFHNQSYKVSFDWDDLGTDKPKKITLAHNYKGQLGTFTVQRIEYNELTRSIDLYV